MGHRAGFEPATSRVAGEVTEIFTTDRVGVGGERAMLLPLRGARTELRHFSRRDSNSRLPSWQAGTALYRSNRHLHHPQADAVAPAVEGDAGERAISASVTTTQDRPCGWTCAGPRAYLFRGRIPVRVSKAGGITRFALRRSIRHLHHQRRLSREDRGKPSYKKSLWRRCRRAACCEPFWVRSAIGVRLIASFPPAGPAHLGTRLSSASPEIRVSRSGHGRDVRWSRAAGNKKPSGAAGSGGSVRSGLSILRSGKIAPMSRACAIE